VRVRALIQTRWRGLVLRAGDVCEVPDVVGARWMHYGIAARLPDPTPEGLPGDFPAKAALEAAGVTTVEAVPREAEALVSIPGIGKASARRILERLR